MIWLNCLVWPFWTGCTELKKPIKLTPDGQLIDADGIRLKPYKAVPGILRSLKKSNFEMAVVGRTGEEVLDKYNWREFFRYIILEPGPKVNHIAKLCKMSKIIPEEMLFYAHEYDEAVSIAKNRTTSVYVNREFKSEFFMYGLTNYLNNIQKFVRNPHKSFTLVPSRYD
ncbi:uncharacterized protein LOC142328586 isoform X3 [Lycorma delicatula]|uniref:uncharacterized protein LOC142328586 isoform X3 n=1 Tax=Lycorma delicatula TaxID=130591 RepID=UPI003F516EC6